MSILTDEERASIAGEFESWMDCSAVIVRGGVTSTSKCSMFPFKGRLPQGIESELAVGLMGRAAWKLRMPESANIDRTCALTVTTPKGAVHRLAVLQVVRSYSLSTRVTVICTELLGAMLSDLVEIWGLSLNPSTGRRTKPLAQVASDVPCNIAEAASLPEPLQQDMARKYSTDLREYRILCFAPETILAYPDIAKDWEFRIHKNGVTTRYVVLDCPPIDETLPSTVEVTCKVVVL